MTDLVGSLLNALDLEQIGEDRFRGRSIKTAWQRVFGGQTIAQSLEAAQRTVDSSRRAHSLHAYFLLGGDSTQPIDYEVERIRDGSSFATRRVVARQFDKPIFTLSASFQIEEVGLDYQFPIPLDAPPPEEIENPQQLAERLGDHIPEMIRRFWQRDRPIEIRPVSLKHYLTREKLEPRQLIWVRFAGTVPDDYQRRAALLAYLSDMTLLDTSTFPHGMKVLDHDIQAASLDHAMWFHRDHPLNDWMLYAQDSPSSSGARGLARGLLYGRDGVLIASVVQEGLIRVRDLPKN